MDFATQPSEQSLFKAECSIMQAHHAVLPKPAGEMHYIPEGFGGPKLGPKSRIGGPHVRIGAECHFADAQSHVPRV